MIFELPTAICLILFHNFFFILLYPNVTSNVQNQSDCVILYSNRLTVTSPFYAFSDWN